MTTVAQLKLPTAPSPSHPLFLTVKTFREYFTRDAIIEELCRARVTLAKKRNDSLFVHRISKSHPSAETRGGQLSRDLDGMFPPRRKWATFRPKRRKSGQDSQRLNKAALTRAVKFLMAREPNLPWVQKLKSKAFSIQSRVLGESPFLFQSPLVLAVEKDPKIHTFRPLAIYNLEDKIIECLVARYLRESLDFLFLPSALAFRTRQENQAEPVTTHTALARIMRINGKYSKIFVAEADIRAFFDCVCHSRVKESFAELAEEATRARPLWKIDERAVHILDAYLQSYSFQNQVLGQGLNDLMKKNRKATFPWPDVALQNLHGKCDLSGIGVPQGGALSCFIANLVLHNADKDIENLRKKRKEAICYMRYCDDMIILSPKRATCQAALAVYKTSLAAQKLPLHEPEDAIEYKGEGRRSFWAKKSKNTYRWGPSSLGIPWVQFVGYQVRHDGLVRVRPKSLKKHLTKLTTATNEMLNVINPRRDRNEGSPVYSPSIRKNAREIQHRFRMKLLSLAVGRRILGQKMPETSDEIMPMCWAKGFRGLRGVPHIRSHLKLLDSHRERQLRRVESRLRHFPKSVSTPTEETLRRRHIRYYGSPFSYHGQFAVQITQ